MDPKPIEEKPVGCVTFFVVGFVVCAGIFLALCAVCYVVLRIMIWWTAAGQG